MEECGGRGVGQAYCRRAGGMRPRVMAFMTMSAALVAPSLRMMWLRGLDGILGDVEDGCDLAGVLAVGYQLEYFELFRGEGGASGPGFAA